jgi:hypothetical protein
LEQILRGTPVKLCGAGKLGLAKITFRQQMRSFVLKRSNKMETPAMYLFFLKLDLSNSMSSSGVRHCFQNTFQFFPL